MPTGASSTAPPFAAAPATTPSGLDPVAGVSLEGEPVGLDDFRGRYVFVNVWSSW